MRYATVNPPRVKAVVTYRTARRHLARYPKHHVPYPPSEALRWVWRDVQRELADGLRREMREIAEFYWFLDDGVVSEVMGKTVRVVTS